jgi:anti-sigma B factor antagonist
MDFIKKLMGAQPDDIGPVIQAPPRLTTNLSRTFGDRLKKLIQRGEHEVLIIDFSKTDYIDSSALGEIESARRRAVEAGKELVLACMNRRLEDLYRVTRMNTLYRIYPTVEEALASGKEPDPPGPMAA